MDDSIDEAINEPSAAPDSEYERPKKRQKITHDAQEEEVDEEKLHLLRDELIYLKVHHPDLELTRTGQVRKEVEKLSYTQVQQELRSMKTELQVSLPGMNATGFLSGLGLALDRIVGVRGLGDKFLADPKMLSLADYYVPTEYSWMSIPLQLLHRVATHIYDAKSGK